MINTDRQYRAILSRMAREDPNTFLQRMYEAGLDRSDIEDMKHLINIARRANGYVESKDPLKLNGVC